jgi:hypothetical protein
MIRYSWKKIQRVAGRSSLRILATIQSMITTQLPRNKYELLYTYMQKDFSGDSYLLDPYSIIFERGYTPKERADYIGLASLRNYAEYLTTNDASLDIFHSPLKEAAIKQNRLLSIENGRIRFKYEEVMNRRI